MTTTLTATTYPPSPPTHLPTVSTCCGLKPVASQAAQSKALWKAVATSTYLAPPASAAEPLHLAPPSPAAEPLHLAPPSPAAEPLHLALPSSAVEPQQHLAPSSSAAEPLHLAPPSPAVEPLHLAPPSPAAEPLHLAPPSSAADPQHPTPPSSAADTPHCEPECEVRQPEVPRTQAQQGPQVLLNRQLKPKVLEHLQVIRYQDVAVRFTIITIPVY